MDELNRDESVESDFEPLKIYFDQWHWNELSVYEKQRFARIKRNYENLMEMGVNPAVPPFMVKKKRVETATCSQTDSRKKKIYPEISTINPPINATTSNCEFGSEEAEGDIEITEVRRSNWIPSIDWENLPLGDSNPFIPDESDEMNIDLILEGTLKNLGSLKLLRKPCDSDLCDTARESDNEPRPRFPKRNVPKVCYREEDVSSDDDYIYCDDCGEQYEGSCPKHGPLNFVKDKKAPPGPRHAWNTCPDYISVCRSGIRGAGLGIWTEIDLSKGYVFGPYKGKTVKSRKEAKDSGYAWEIRKSGKVLHYVEGVDTSVSNWMRFVNCAVCEERQNLIAFQYHGQIMYRVYKEVKAYTELFVWYGDEFGEELGIFRNEETPLLKGVMKKPEYDRGVAPSSSTRKIYYSETLQDQSKRTASQPTFRKAVSSSDVPGEINKDEISQKSEYGKRGNIGISTENDVGQKSGGEKREGMDFITEEILVLSDQNKHASFAEKNTVCRKCRACPQCDYKTPYAASLRRHINAIHENKRPYKCQMCDYSASSSGNLKQHVHAVHEGIRRYKCKQCDFRASRAEHLRSHVDSVHERKKPFKCQHCDYRASQSTHLRTHVATVHEGKKPYKCQLCEYRASQSTHLRTHVATVHEGKKPYKCQLCDYRASQSTRLRTHVATVHEGKKPCKCQLCDYRASQSTRLRTHVATVHEGKKPYKCQLCDYRASQIRDLRRHVDAVHDGKKPNQCQHCDYRASQASYLRRHVAAVHDGKKPYQCQHCDYKASQASYLRRHVAAVHEGKKPHPCPHCHYRATSAGTVRKHVRAVHERMKPYGCRICDFRTSWSDTLRRHMKAVHFGKENTGMSNE